MKYCSTIYLLILAVAFTQPTFAQTKKIQSFNFEQGIIATDTTWEYLNTTRIYNRNGFTMSSPAQSLIIDLIEKGRASEYEGHLLDYVGLSIIDDPVLLFALDSMWLYTSFNGKDYGYINQFSPGVIQTFGGDYDFTTLTVDKKEHLKFTLNPSGKITSRTISDVDYDMYPISYDIIPRSDYTYTYDNLGNVVEMVRRVWDINNPSAPPEYAEKETWEYYNSQLITYKKYYYDYPGSWEQREEKNYQYNMGKLYKVTATRIANAYIEEFTYEYNSSNQVFKVTKHQGYANTPLELDSYKQYAYSGNKVIEEIDRRDYGLYVFQNTYDNGILTQTIGKEVNLNTNDTLSKWLLTIERDQDGDVVTMIHNNLDNEPPYTNTDYRSTIAYAFVTDTGQTNHIKEITEQLNLVLYPNPATDVLTFASEKDLHNAMVLITGIDGKPVKRFVHMHENSIDIADLPSGPYILKVDLEKYSGTARFIKK